jgi:deltex-like protein
MKFFKKKAPSAAAAAAASPLQRFHQAQSSFNSSSLQAEHDRLSIDETISYNAPSTLSQSHGPGPSGTMKINMLPQLPCPGFASGGAIQMSYDLPTGRQLHYHPNPGSQYDGALRRTFLPNTAEGRCLLTRFKYAFKNGFMFCIGKSIASGLDNQVTWSQIPNKTSLKGGSFGFPDDNYIPKANVALDKLGIPSTDACLNYTGGLVRILIPTKPLVKENHDDDRLFVVKKGTIHYNAPSSLASSLDGLLLPFKPSTACAPSSVTSPYPSSARPLGAAVAAAAAYYLPPAMLPPSAPPPTTSSDVQPLPSASLQPAPIITAADLTSGTTLPASLMATLTGTSKPPPQLNTTTGGTLQQTDCAICLDALSQETSVQLAICKHAFHRSCITDALQHVAKCPVCRQPLSDEPQGKSPSGTMTIEILDIPCPGFAGSTTTISMVYDIPSGTQSAYHDQPGERYDGTCRVAYLPHTLEGKQLLARLQYAWTHGLTFRVGTSLTTGTKNQVTWASIHHKTSVHGGPHGFPDSNYIGE